jgi:hypothetical protein
LIRSVGVIASGELTVRVQGREELGGAGGVVENIGQAAVEVAELDGFQLSAKEIVGALVGVGIHVVVSGNDPDILTADLELGAELGEPVGGVGVLGGLALGRDVTGDEKGRGAAEAVALCDGVVSKLRADSLIELVWVIARARTEVDIREMEEDEHDQGRVERRFDGPMTSVGQAARRGLVGELKG